MYIINEPNDGYEYEFVVALELNENMFLFIGHYTNGFEAERKAIEVNGIVIHNVRIQGRRKR